jgi:hypothetical protein
VKASSQWITPLIVKAGRSFVSAKGKDTAEEGAELAEFLRSDEPIGKEERELLAQLVTGDWRNRKGRPERIGPGHAYAIALVSDYRRRIAENGPNGEEAAAQDTAKHFGETTRTVRRYAKETRDREKAVEKAQVKVAK